VLTLVSSTFLLYDWVVERFLKRPTIALLLHRISRVTQCVCIITKALPLFILLWGRKHKPSLWGLGLLHASSFGLVHMFVGDLERMCVKTSRDLPHTCSCTWCFIQKPKGGNKRDSTGSRTREPYFIRTQIFLFFNFIFTMRLTQSRLS
jgi:hypothetical protein